jgi:hypothetical protein
MTRQARHPRLVDLAAGKVSDAPRAVPVEGAVQPRTRAASLPMAQPNAEQLPRGRGRGRLMPPRCGLTEPPVRETGLPSSLLGRAAGSERRLRAESPGLGAARVLTTGPAAAPSSDAKASPPATQSSHVPRQGRRGQGSPQESPKPSAAISVIRSKHRPRRSAANAVRTAR